VPQPRAPFPSGGQVGGAVSEPSGPRTT
jgi:hypothetical protein